MSKVRSRLGRGLSSLLTVSEQADEPLATPAPADAGHAGPPPGEGRTPLPTVATVVPTPGGLPVMRELPAVENAGTAEPNPADTPTAPAGHLPDNGRYLVVPVAAIVPNPHQPRKHFDQGRLKELAESLRESGVIQPIIVRPSNVPGGGYELIAGERRWRAASLAGILALPAIVRHADDAIQARLALVENVQREDLNPIDRAAAYATLLKTLGITQQELASQLGEDRSSIANFLRLLDLAESVQHLVADGRLSAGHAKVLAGVPDIAEQSRLAEMVVQQDLSVRALEGMIKKGSALPPSPPPRRVPLRICSIWSNRCLGSSACGCRFGRSVRAKPRGNW